MIVRGLRLGVLFLAATALAADDPAKDVTFRADVAPILVRKCLACHNNRKAAGGLNITTFARLRKGGKTHGAEIVVPGDAEASVLIECVQADAEPRMPYRLPPLSRGEVATLERWVRDGAKFDGGSETETRLASLVDPLSGLPKVEVKVPVADPVAAVTFSPDGKRLAAARGREILVFDVAEAKPLATLGDHAGPIRFVGFTPDGKRLVAAGGRAGQFGIVVVWDLDARRKLHDVRGHEDEILSAALSRDGTTLATGGPDRLIRLWNVAAGKLLRTLKEHTDSVHGLDLSPDGTTLASASADRTIKVWDVATGRRRVTLSDATAEQYAARFSPDGKRVLGAGVDRTIRAWTLAGDTAELTGTAIAHDGPILRLIVSPDGASLWSCGEDRAIQRRDLATLAPRSVFGSQPDWPLGLAASPDGHTVAVGRYDGSLALLDAESGKVLKDLLAAPGATPAPSKPQLARNASLNPPSPRGAARGTTARVTLTGTGVGLADRVRFDDPAMVATLVTPAKPDPNRLELDLAIGTGTGAGVHRFVVHTPMGTPTAQTFAVAAEPEFPVAEPEGDLAAAKVVELPATLVGAIDKPGDEDFVRFRAQAGQVVVFETLARGLGSAHTGSLAVLDADGKVLAESIETDESFDPRLVFPAPREGMYALRIRDLEYGGSANHFYRIRAGFQPLVRAVFPLGAAPGQAVNVAVSGVNLGDGSRVELTIPRDARPGTMVTVPIPNATRSPRLIVAEGEQGVENEPNDQSAQASPLANPGGASGRIDRSGDVDHFRLDARKGRRLVIEVHGRRLGSPIDPAIEILDAQGRPIPRALLRPVAETNVAFRDHGSLQRSIRLTVWNDLAVGDHVLVGRELMRLFELPRNPDDDAVFWGLGMARTSPGERIGFLGTTPEQHPMGQAITKVEIHPPGTKLPAGGKPPVTLYHRNDDGGPGYGKDPALIFDPPADGTYLVRVEDAQGQGGERLGYHLAARPARPDFALSLSTESPNIPRGGTAIVVASLRRIDGFDGPVEVSVAGLPPGITASRTRIEEGQFAAELGLTADADAPAFAEVPWTVTGRGFVDEKSFAGSEVVHTIRPGDGLGKGWITVVDLPNLAVRPGADDLVIRPGERISFPLSVERGPAFQGRVPIDVRGLPFGVRVLNVGLNGVLVTEKDTERSVFLYAESWAEPQERAFFAVGKCEAAGTEHGSRPIRLRVEVGPKADRRP